MTEVCRALTQFRQRWRIGGSPKSLWRNCTCADEQASSANSAAHPGLAELLPNRPDRRLGAKPVNPHRHPVQVFEPERLEYFSSIGTESTRPLAGRCFGSAVPVTRRTPCSFQEVQ